MAWLFDVDGVLTDPEQKRIIIPEIVDELIRRLKKGEPVGLNTGRSLEFIIREVLTPTENKIDDKSLLRNIFALGENGCMRIIYDHDGKRIKNIDRQFTIPLDLKKIVKNLISESFDNLVFFDEEKRTMITVELNKDRTVEEFQIAKKELVDLFEDTLVQMNLNREWVVDTSRIAIDIHHKNIDKGFGARKFIELLDKSKISPLEFTEFGDSQSDYKMDEELRSMGKKTTFVFVGDKCDKGTLEYLQSH